MIELSETGLAFTIDSNSICEFIFHYGAPVKVVNTSICKLEQIFVDTIRSNAGASASIPCFVIGNDTERNHLSLGR